VRYDRIFLIVITIGITFSILPFVTAEDPVTVSTSKDIYYEGDTVIVFGKISGAFGGLPVIIELYHGDSLIAVDQIEIALDGSFATDFTASGQFWNEDGTYIARAFYTPEKIAEKAFQFFQKRSDSISEIFPVDIPNAGSFDVGYSVIGAEVKNMILNNERYSLLVQLDPSSNGNIVIKLPREYFDAITDDDKVEKFIVLISKTGTDDLDFEEIETEEIEIGPDFRTIRIQFDDNDKWIEIIGTHVIPEFGTVIIMILLIAITSTIILSKSKFSVRYN